MIKKVFEETQANNTNINNIITSLLEVDSDNPDQKEIESKLAALNGEEKDAKLPPVLPK